jgi:hypothetical protein
MQPWSSFSVGRRFHLMLCCLCGFYSSLSFPTSKSISHTTPGPSSQISFAMVLPEDTFLVAQHTGATAADLSANARQCYHSVVNLRTSADARTANNTAPTAVRGEGGAVAAANQVLSHQARQKQLEAEAGPRQGSLITGHIQQQPHSNQHFKQLCRK